MTNYQLLSIEITDSLNIQLQFHISILHYYSHIQSELRMLRLNTDDDRIMQIVINLTICWGVEGLLSRDRIAVCV